MQPTVRAILLFAVGLPVSLLPAAIDPRLWTVWIVFMALALGAVVIDALLSIPSSRLKITALAPSTLYIGDADPLRVELVAEGWTRAVKLELLGEFGERLTAPEIVQVEIVPDAENVAEVPLAPKRRGMASIIALWARWMGPFGLIARTTRREVDAQVPIKPNIRAVRAAAMQLLSSRNDLVGNRVQRFLGDGSAFESLREYRKGMDHRAMDWKASARHRKLICRRFQAERNHQIVIAFDTGHLMSEPLRKVPKLDHAINAGLLLAYYALRTGDRVGVYGFDERVGPLQAPVAGVQAFHTLQDRAAQLEYSPNETNFTLGLSHLSRKLRRRSLIVVLTDFVDSITAELMVDNLHRLARKHLVVFVSIRDPGLVEVVQSRPQQTLDVHRSVVARGVITERQKVLGALRRRGVLVLDAVPEQISPQLLDRYLKIKRREQI